MGHKCLLIDVLSPLVSQFLVGGMVNKAYGSSRIFRRVATNIGNAVADMSNYVKTYGLLKGGMIPLSGWCFGTGFFPMIYGMSSFPLTNSYVSEWLKPPTSYVT